MSSAAPVLAAVVTSLTILGHKHTDLCTLVWSSSGQLELPALKWSRVIAWIKGDCANGLAAFALLSHLARRKRVEDGDSGRLDDSEGGLSRLDGVDDSALPGSLGVGIWSVTGLAADVMMPVCGLTT